MEHVYSVTANTTKGGVKWYRILVIAHNQADAKDIAKDAWTRQGGEAHLFRLAAARTTDSYTPDRGLWHLTDEKTPSGNWISYV